MNNKTNIFVCALIALSINLQCSISAYAAEEASAEVTEHLNVSEAEIITEEDNKSTDAEIINGAEDLSVHAFAQDDQTN